MNNKPYEVWLSAHKEDDNEKPFKTDVLFANEKGLKLLFIIFKYIKNEMEGLRRSNIQNDNDFNDITQILINSYSTKFENKGDLEDTIVEHIEQLKKNKFYRGLVTKMTIKDLIEMLYSLRRERIKFWQSILTEYKKNKENYNKKLKEFNEKRFSKRTFLD